LHFWQNPKADKHGQDRRKYFEEAAIFHEFNFSFIVLAFPDFSLENSFPAVHFLRGPSQNLRRKRFYQNADACVKKKKLKKGRRESCGRRAALAC